MKLNTKLIVALALACIRTHAAVPPPEQLLSSDTVAVLAVPDWTKSQETLAASPSGQLWRDPEIKAFKDKFLNRCQEEVIAPIEKQLGIKLSDYAELLQGEAAIAVTFKPGEGDEDPTVGWCVIIDTKDKSEQLKKSLEDFKKKWVDGGKQIKTEKIRDVDFASISFTGDDVLGTVKKAFPGAAEDSDSKSTNKVSLLVGQSGSLLLLGGKVNDLEKILARQSGGQVTPLADVPEFQSNQAMFRDTVGYGWINLKPVFATIKKKLAQMSAGNKGENPMNVKPDKVFAALGLEGLKTISYSLSFSPEGNLVKFFVNVSEADRKGLLKVFSYEAKNAGPPPFVPVDAVKFNRWRLNGQKSWASLKATVTEISPEVGGMIQMGLAMAGKDKDPNFDLEKSLIGNLSDDIITYQKNPKDFNAESLNSPPSIVLLGSANAEALAQALYAGTGLAVPPTQVKQREFLGHKITSFPLPALPNSVGDNDKTLSFGAGGGYVALSTDDAMLEEYLRGSDNKAKPLAELEGLKEASQKVGGMETGLWGYENQAETFRAALETLKRDSSSFEKLFNLTPLAKGKEDGDKAGLKAWLDFSLLPSYDKLSKYFSFTVYAGALQSEGFGVKAYSPVPPSFKK